MACSRLGVAMAMVMPMAVGTMALAAGAGAATPDGGLTGGGSRPDFDRDVAPLLARRCLQCHRGPEAKGGLDLSLRRTVLTGGKSGPALVPGNVDESTLWQRVFEGEMPPKAPLDDLEKAAIRGWIAAGAAWGTDPIDPFRITTDRRAGYDWWSLRPVRRPAVPGPVADSSWARNPIDRFVGARLDAEGLKPAPEADRRTLIRRLSFDLLGLPPDPDEVDSFTADASPLAYERLVDRLLASPHHGERWARHWLDVARFGESDGFERNTTRANAWYYRNWVIAAFNADLPYDEFARLQVAGDVLRPGDTAAAQATGFLVAGVHNTVLGNDLMRAVARQDELEDIVGTFSQAFLGLTVNCARCHDHKFDPIAQADYYRLASALGGVSHGEREFPDIPVQRELARLDAVIRELSQPARARERPGPADSLQETRRQLLAERAAWSARTSFRCFVAVSEPAPVTRVLLRGQVTEPGEVVAPGGLAALGGSLPAFRLSPDAPEAERRRMLAGWLTGSANPLLARVMVNRFWQNHFGTGLVETPSDFGFNGGRPSHPELLDWLAAELAGCGYRLKAMHRLIVTSATYRQASTPCPAGRARDADNRLLWRKTARRSEGEAVRDAMLAVAGLLNREVGGRGFSDYRETFLNGTTYFEPIDPAGAAFHRRSVYRFLPRGANQGLLDTLDCPDPAATAPRRSTTNTPIQALAMWNDAFVFRMAGAFASRVAAEVPGRAGDATILDRRIARAWRLAYQRDPRGSERRAAARLVAAHGLTALGRVLFNTNEFLTVE